MTELTLKPYGALDARDYIPGAEALADGEAEASGDESEDDDASDDDDSEGGWVDVSHSEDEDVEIKTSDEEEDDDDDGEEDEEDDEDDEDAGSEEEEDASGSEEGDESGDSDDESNSEEEEEDSDEESETTGTSLQKRLRKKRDKKKLKRLRRDLQSMHKKTKKLEDEAPSVVEERKSKAAEVSLGRFLTDKDFSKIEATQLKKQMEVAKAKRKAAEDIDALVKRYLVSPVAMRILLLRSLTAEGQRVCLRLRLSYMSLLPGERWARGPVAILFILEGSSHNGSPTCLVSSKWLALATFLFGSEAIRNRTRKSSRAAEVRRWTFSHCRVEGA